MKPYCADESATPDICPRTGIPDHICECWRLQPDLDAALSPEQVQEARSRWSET